MLQSKISRRLVTAVIAAPVSVALLSAPANAGKSSFISRTTGRTANVQWDQRDGTPTGSQFGNVHLGFLEAYETSSGRASVFGWITDFDCDPGEEPGGGHGEEPTEGVCDLLGDRFIDTPDIAFTVDSKLTTANLVGNLTIYGGGHGEAGVVGRPPINAVFTGVGDLAKESFTYRYSEGGTTYSDTYRASARNATVSGVMGPMLFENAASQSARITDFKSSFRERTK